MTDIAKLGFEIDSTPLTKAGIEAQKAAQQLGAMGEAADKAGQKTKAAGKEVGSAEQTVKGFGKTIGEAASGVDDLAGAIAGGGGGLAGATSILSRGLGSAGAALGGISGAAVGAAAGAVVLVGSFAKLSTVLAEAQDRAALLEGRLRNALGSTSDATAALAQLYDQTQKTGLGFDSAAESFLRIARNAESLGATKGDILQLTDTIQKLGKASGASTGEIQSGMMQLGQALASGRLNGDELRSIMENMPALAKAIADGLGVSVGQIRALGAAGELTSDKVFKAILAASGKANEEFAKLPDTVAQANQRTADSWDALLVTLGQKWDSSSLVRNSVNWLGGLISGTNEALKGDTVGTQISSLEREVAQQRKLGDTTETRRKIARLESDIAALRSQAQKQIDADSADRNAKDIQMARAGIQRGIELGQNEFDDFNKKVSKAKKDAETLRNTIGDINVRIKSGLATNEDRAALPALNRQLAVADAGVRDLANGIDKATKSYSDFQRAVKMGGGGGGTSIVQQAMEQRRQAESQSGVGRGGSLDGYIGIGVRDAAAKAQGEITNLERQSRTQLALAASVRDTRDQIREMEIAQETANFQFQKFGTLTGPAVTKTVKQYEDALRSAKVATDVLADSRLKKSIDDDIAGLARQAKANRDLSQNLGRTRAEIRELEIAQESLNYKFAKFGSREGPDVVQAMQDYEAQLRATKIAADDLASARAFQGTYDEINGLAGQQAAMSAGPFAMREAAARQRAEIANRTTSGLGEQQMVAFRVGERTSADQQIMEMRVATDRMREDIRLLGDPAGQRQVGIDRQVTDATRNVIGERRDDIEDEIRTRAEVEQTKEMAAQSAEIRRQIAMNKERLGIMGLTGEKLVVETMLLERRNQLQMQGVDLESEQAKAVLASTEELAKQQYQIQKAQEQTEAYKRVWTNAARMIQESLSDAFEQAFRKGEFSAKSFFNLVGDIALRVSSDIISAMVYKPLEGLLMDLGTSLGASIFPGAAKAGGVPNTGTAAGAMSSGPRAFGGYTTGNVIPFARGGMLSQPTVFGMANGGTGVAGEAGPEAVLPLKRGLDGRLGVGGGTGGNVSIQIIDQRSGENSRPVEATESRGPDGQRMIQILVRDEVRRAIRSGDLDRDLQSSYGNQRRLVTR